MSKKFSFFSFSGNARLCPLTALMNRSKQQAGCGKHKSAKHKAAICAMLIPGIQDRDDALAFFASHSYDYFMKVTGLGQCSLDNIFVVNSYPDLDTKVEASEWTTAGGGPVATALVSLSRLGLQCSFHGITGDDDPGHAIAESLRRENIDISGLITRPHADSQVAFICVEKGTGKRTIFWKRPSCGPLKPQELGDSFLSDSDFLLVDGLMPGPSLFAARKARDMNVPVMLDAGRVREGMIELAQLCDYVVGSEEFAREFTKDEGPFDPERAITKLRSLGIGTVTVTLGDRGSITAQGDDLFHMPAFPVHAVDTTGAGDVFHGGYIYGLLQDRDIKDVVRFASAFAALKCRRLGGREGIPSLQDVEDFLSAHGPC